MLCAICSGVYIESRISEPHWQETWWPISTLSRNRNCELCRILYGKFLRTAGHEAYYRGFARGIVHRVEEIDSTYLQHPTLSLEFVKSTIGGSEQTLESSYSLQLNHSPAAAKCVFEGQTLSYALVKTWLNDCDANHDCIRGHPPRRRNVGFYVIDVQDECIVRAPPNCRYVALSYSWGQVKQTRLKKSNITRLEKKGGLRRKRIPRTIMDALSICASLGVRYLWVDRLCIVQNSPSHGNSQLAHMDQIYSGAYVTIIAATGSDSASGIFAPRPQNEVQHTVKLGKATYVAVPNRDGLEESLANSVWASRAWTLQEFVLSRRCLIFTGDECFLYCGKGAYVSGLSIGHLLPPPESFGLSLLGYRLPYWKGDGIIYRRYARLVVSYMSRELSFNKDVLRGFEGISRLLMRYLGRFRWGLPDSIIRWSLCWTHTEPMYRRRWMHTEDLIRKPGIPSWTWAGWEKLETDISNMRPEYPTWSWVGLGKNGQASHMIPSTPAWSWKGLPKSENGIHERRIPAKTSLTFPDYLAHQFWPPCSVYYWTSNVTMRQIPSSFDTSESKCPAFDDECRQSYEYIRDNARWIWNQSLTGKSFSTRSYRRLLSVSSPAFKDVPGVNFRHILTFASFYASLPVPPRDVLNGQRALEPIPVLEPPSVAEDQIMNGEIPGPSRLRQTCIFLGVLNHPARHFAVVLPVHVDKLALGTKGKADQLVVRRCGDPYRVEADAWFNRLSRRCIAHLR